MDTSGYKIIEKDIVVLGAGLTGLTASHYLSRGKKDFLVLETANRVGGVINTVKEGGFLYEEGPNTGVIGNSDVADLFDELKDYCTLEKAAGTVNKRYILKKGKWEAVPSGLIGGIKTPLFTLKDKFRILGEPFRKPGTNPHETLAELVKRRMGQSFLDYAVDPFIKGVYAGDPNYLIPKYALPKLYNLEQNYGSFIGGSIKKKRKERDDVNAKKATREVFSVDGGLVNLVKAMHKSSGEENFILNAENITVNREGEKYLITLNHKGEKIVIKANSVISTVGAYNLDKTFPFIEKELISGITNLHYTKVIEAVIGFKNWKGFNLDGFGGLIPTKEKRDILGVLFLSSFLKDRAPKDGALLTVFMGGVKGIHLIEKPEEEIKETIIREVKDLMEIEDFNPDLFKIILHNKAIPQYGLDSEIRFKNVELIENQNPGLSIAGNLKDGIGMADRIKQGKMIAGRYI